MTLKAVIDSLDAAPPALAEHYVERDGRFYLDAEDMEHVADIRALKTALEREKSERKAARAALDAERTRFAGLDPAAARAALESTQALNERLATAESERLALDAALRRHRIDDALGAAALAANVRKTAIEDVLNRGRALFTLDEDAKLAHEAGAGGAAPTVEDWITGLRAEAPHLFEGAAGGGAAGSAPAPAGPVIDLDQPNAIGRNLIALARGAHAAPG